jgi:hypothetical protein
MTLWALLITCLAVGCVMIGPRERMPIPPDRPELTRLPSPEGVVCLDEENLKELLIYIRKLEEGYEH